MARASAVGNCLGSTFSLGSRLLSDPDNSPSSKVLKASDGVDKAIKLGRGIDVFGKWIATEMHAPQDTLEKFDKADKFFCNARDATSMFNAIVNIPETVRAAINTGKVALGIIKGKKEVDFTAKGKDPQYNTKAVGRKEMTLKTLSEATKTGSKMAFGAAFGPIKWAYVLNKHCDVSLGPTSQKMANSFTPAFTGYHCLQWLHHGLDSWFQYEAYKRALGTNGINQMAAHQIYMKSLAQNGVGWLNTNFELALDAAKLLNRTDPRFVAPLTLVVGILSFVKVCMKTA